MSSAKPSPRELIARERIAQVRKEQHAIWCRRLKTAIAELGYVSPQQVLERMEQMAKAEVEVAHV